MVCFLVLLGSLFCCVCWGSSHPFKVPQCTLHTFYNKKLQRPSITSTFVQGEWLVSARQRPTFHDPRELRWASRSKSWRPEPFVNSARWGDRAPVSSTQRFLESELTTWQRLQYGDYTAALYGNLMYSVSGLPSTEYQGSSTIDKKMSSQHWCVNMCEQSGKQESEPQGPGTKKLVGRQN